MVKIKELLLSPLWKEGLVVDLWSINHLLFGVIAASFCIWFRLGFWTSVTISLVVMILWEIFEIWHDSIFEHNPNIIFDVILGLVGFLITYYLIQAKNLVDYVPKIFWISVVISLILLGIGYYNFLHRTKIVEQNSLTHTEETP